EGHLREPREERRPSLARFEHALPFPTRIQTQILISRRAPVARLSAVRSWRLGLGGRPLLLPTALGRKGDRSAICVHSSPPATPPPRSASCRPLSAAGP